MNKQEFIEGLRRSLSSINDYTFVNDTIAYYENYIESQIRMGKTEEEVMEELGDPRLIAKSIKATHTMEEEEMEQEYYRDSYRDSYAEEKPYSKTIFSFNGKTHQVPSWLVKIVGMVILLLVFWLVFTVLSWLAPFIMMSVLAYIVYKVFFGKY